MRVARPAYGTIPQVTLVLIILKTLMWASAPARSIYILLRYRKVWMIECTSGWRGGERGGGGGGGKGEAEGGREKGRGD